MYSIRIPESYSTLPNWDKLTSTEELAIASLVSFAQNKDLVHGERVQILRNGLKNMYGFDKVGKKQWTRILKRLEQLGFITYFRTTKDRNSYYMIEFSEELLKATPKTEESQRLKNKHRSIKPIHKSIQAKSWHSSSNNEKGVIFDKLRNYVIKQGDNDYDKIIDILYELKSIYKRSKTWQKVIDQIIREVYQAKNKQKQREFILAQTNSPKGHQCPVYNQSNKLDCSGAADERSSQLPEHVKQITSTIYAFGI